LGADIIIAVDLCELLPKTFPTNLLQVADRSAEIAFMWQNQACTRLADFVIRPKTCGAGTFNDKMKQQVYEAGRTAAREVMDEIVAKVAPLTNRPIDTCECRLVTLGCYTPQICTDELHHEELLAEANDT
jgi:NTE family protein